MSDGTNWNGTPAPGPVPAPAQKPPSRFRYILPILILIALGIVAYPWVRPMLKSDACHPGGQSNVLNVGLTLCVDPARWTAILTFEPGKTSFGAGNDKIYFDTFGQAKPIPFTELSSVILRYSKQFATNNEDLKVSKEWSTDLGGKTWKVIEFASQTADLVVYYYSAEGFGSAELFFMSFTPDVARRDELAAPILQSVKFTGAAR